MLCNKYCVLLKSLYTKKAVKCADPTDRKVKRLLRKLLLRQRTKDHRTMWLLPRDNLPVMSEVRDTTNRTAFNVIKQKVRDFHVVHL